jgi:hypothetical protein
MKFWECAIDFDSVTSLGNTNQKAHGSLSVGFLKRCQEHLPE